MEDGKRGSQTARIGTRMLKPPDDLGRDDVRRVAAPASWGGAVWGLVAALGIGAGAGGCNETPASGTLDDLTIEVESKLSNTDPVKLDILWVIDNSTSMCQEQNSLADNVNEFVETFSQFNIDLRMAVVNTNGISEAAQGTFQAKRFDGPYPPNCFEGEVLSCLKAEDCTQALGDAAWACNPPLNGQAQYLTNANCSLNSECRYTCTTDEECREKFGDDTLRCFVPGGDESQSRCQRPPPTSDCPSELPLWVSTEDGNVDIFRCLAVVGAVQTQDAQLEQGLNAAVWALDRNPPSGAPDRSQQARDFVRSDAYQLVIFISDEDDCSMALKGGKLQSVAKELWNSCGCLDDESENGPLANVSSLVARLRTVNNSSRVLVAAIVGDVVVGEQTGTTCLNCPEDGNVEACIADKRKAFFDSKCGPGPVAQNTYVCQSVSGKADYGNRYVEFVRQFGSNGVIANICNDAGFGPALDDIASAILNRIVRYCLPRPVKPGTKVRVTRRDEVSGETTVLTEDVDYEIRDAVDCPDDGPKKAVFFKERLEPGQEITVVYEAFIFGQ